MPVAVPDTVPPQNLQCDDRNGRRKGVVVIQL